MASDPIERLHARARVVRARAAVRRWSYRQRNLAAGVWFRLRRALAEAKAAYEIPDAEAHRLLAEGYRLEPCGGELAPEKTILFVDEARLSAVEGRRAIPVSLGPEFLAARTIALVPFDEAQLPPARTRP